MSDDLLGGGSSADTGSGGGALLPEGFYPELRLVKFKLAKGKKSPYARYISADLEVLVPANGADAGQHGDFYEQLELNKFPEHDKEGRGRVMKFLGALFGYSTVAQIDAHCNTQTLVLVCSDLQPETGKVVSGYCKHIVREGKKTIVRWDFGPCIDPSTGKPKLVRPLERAQAPAQAPAAFVPPPAPPAPAAPAIPPGWAIHPQDPKWIYNTLAPSEMRPY
jgi:hypothetical protein